MNLKKITTLTLLIAVIGFSVEVIQLLLLNIDYNFPSFSLVLENGLKPIKLNMFNVKIFDYYNVTNVGDINYLNLFFYALAFIGGILFIVSKQKEMRLIRFIFSLIILQHLLGLFTNFFVLLYNVSEFRQNWFYFSMYVAFNILWVYISYRVLKELSKIQILETDEKIQINQKEDRLVDAPKWQRLFHYIVDNFLCLLLFSPFSQLFYELGVRGIEEFMGVGASSYIFLFLFSLIYFPFYETLLGATPGKFLTRTRVTKNNGDKIDFKVSMIRTLCRFIPLEPISYFGEKGWHDRISNTRVLKEKHEELSVWTSGS